MKITLRKKIWGLFAFFTLLNSFERSNFLLLGKIKSQRVQKIGSESALRYADFFLSIHFVTHCTWPSIHCYLNIALGQKKTNLVIIPSRHFFNIPEYSLGQSLHLAIYSLGHFINKFCYYCTWPLFPVGLLFTWPLIAFGHSFTWPCYKQTWSW